MAGLLDTIGTVSDRLIAAVAPGLALGRASARARLNIVNSYSGSWQQPADPGAGYGRHGASTSKHSMLGWFSRPGNADEDAVKHLEGDNGLRARGRDTWMGVPIARGALRGKAVNAIGPGLRPSPQIDADYLGLSEDEADAWERDTERRFAWWADSPECDAARQLTFGGLQYLAYISAGMSGDVFALLPVIQRKGTIGDLRIQIIEADRVCDPWPLPARDENGAPNIVGGVETGEYGEAVAYHFAPVHPGSNDLTTIRALYSGRWKRVPAYGPRTGRRQVLHVMCGVERPEQRRGIPLFAPVLEIAKQLGRYTQSELDAALATSFLTLFLTTENPEKTLGKLAAGEDASGTDADAPAGTVTPVTPIATGMTAESDDRGAIELGSSQVVELAKGEDIKPVLPTRPNGAFDPFTKAILIQFGAAVGIPYEILAMHFTNSYTAARAEFVEYWKGVTTDRGAFVPQFCRPVYEEWLAGEVAGGRIVAPGFFSSPEIRAAWSGAEWNGPAQGQINERVEVGAADDRVKFGFSTRERETAQLTGRNWHQVIRQRRREVAKEREAGMLPPASTSAPPGQGA